MKRIFYFIAIALLVIGLSTNGFAAANATATGGSNGLNTIRTYTTINSDTGGYDVTNISTSTIIPGKCELVGYSVVTLATANVEGLFDLVDASSSTTGSIDSYIIHEGEVVYNLPAKEIFPEGIEITRGLTVRQGPKTAVTVYYKQVRP